MIIFILQLGEIIFKSMYESKVSQFSQSKLPPFGLSQISSHFSQINASVAPGFTNTQCPSHPQYVITNICRANSCIQPLCPECIPTHIQLHQQSRQPSKIETIVASRVCCIQKLAEQKYYLEADLEKINQEYSTDPETVAADLKTKLANSKSKLIKMIDKIYDQMNEQVEIIYSAYCSEAERNSLEARKVATPISQHLDYITTQKQQLQSDDFISTLIELLSEFPKRPECKQVKKSVNFGSVEVNSKMLEEVHKAIQKYVYVVVNCKQQTNTKLLNIKSNNSKFSRLSAEKSRITERSRSRERSIFESKVIPSPKDTVLESYFNQSGYKVSYESARSTTVQITQADYFDSNGLLAYFQENSRSLHTVNINYIQQGFTRKDLNISFLIPHQHRSVVTPQGQIMLFGGKVNEAPSNKAYILAGDSLLQLPSMNSERFNFGICHHEDGVYVAGGIEAGPINRFERYNIKKRCWTVLRPCLEANYGCELSPFNHFIAKLGGKSSGGVINSIQLYNVQSDSWSSIAFDHSFSVPISCGFAQISQNQLLIFGGFVNDLKTNQASILRFAGNSVTVQKTVQIYSDSSFSNPSYINRRSLIALQNTTKGTSKNILKFNGSQWKFVSC